MDAKGVSDKRIYLHEQPRDLMPDFNTIKTLGVYLGIIPKHEIAMSSSRLRVENDNEGRRTRFRIDIESKNG